MKRSLRQNLCVLAALLLGTSLLITDYVDARGGGGGGSRGGGGGSRGGGGASPRVNRSSDLQNRGNFSNRSQPSRDFSGRQGERQTSQQNRQGEHLGGGKEKTKRAKMPFMETPAITLATTIQTTNRSTVAAFDNVLV